MRLNKYLASCGVASRREADELILSGAVTVNGEKILQPGREVEEGEWVKVRGKTVRPEPLSYYAFHKPAGMITTLSDERGRPCVGDIIQRMKGHLVPVGRLDWNSEGLLLLTNDGDWAHRVLHPSRHVPRVYHVKVRGKLEKGDTQRLLKGVRIDGKLLTMESIRPLKSTRSGNTWWEVVLREGKSRQIRHMMKAVGHPVNSLKRMAIGPIKLGNLKRAEFRRLTAGELEAMNEALDSSERRHP